jgi:hypothetical protein
MILNIKNPAAVLLAIAFLNLCCHGLLFAHSALGYLESFSTIFESIANAAFVLLLLLIIFFLSNRRFDYKGWFAPSVVVSYICLKRFLDRSQIDWWGKVSRKNFILSHENWMVAFGAASLALSIAILARSVVCVRRGFNER